MTSLDTPKCAQEEMSEEELDSDEGEDESNYGVWVSFGKQEGVYKSTELSHFKSMPFEEAKGEVGKKVSLKIKTAKKIWEVDVKQIAGKKIKFGGKMHANISLSGPFLGPGINSAIFYLELS
jgi:hypothetical protein